MYYFKFPYEFPGMIGESLKDVERRYVVIDCNIRIIESPDNNMCSGFPLEHLPMTALRRILKYALAKDVPSRNPQEGFMTLSKYWLEILQNYKYVQNREDLKHPDNIYTPLRFWFTKNPGLALPFVAIRDNNQTLQMYHIPVFRPDEIFRDNVDLSKSLQAATAYKDVTHIPGQQEYYIIFYKSERYLIIKSDIEITCE